MLKGTRDAILKHIQPISIHGQISWEIGFTHVDDPEPCFCRPATGHDKGCVEARGTDGRGSG
jgi:hypothetical protein